MKKTARNQIVFGASPRVDLLPEKQRAEKKHEETLPKLLLVLVVAAVLAGLIWFVGTIPINQANARFNALEQESSDLLVELANYSEVQRAINDIRQLGSLRADVSDSEVLVMSLLDEITEVVPGGATVIEYAVVTADHTESGDGTVLPETMLCGGGVAKLTVKVASDELIPPADLVESVSGITGYDCAQVTRVENQDDRMVTEFVIVVGQDARSGRFQDNSNEANNGE